jgi:hypothetical protein
MHTIDERTEFEAAFDQIFAAEPCAVRVQQVECKDGRLFRASNGWTLELVDGRVYCSNREHLICMSTEKCIYAGDEMPTMREIETQLGHEIAAE